MNEETDQAIEAAYAAFANVAKPGFIDGCRCCIDDYEVATLLTKPLREISEREMSSYASSALLTVGSESDYHYFLPRILEIKVLTPGWWPDWEVIGRAMSSADWETWPIGERRAVIRILESQLKIALSEQDGCEIDGLLCGMAKARLCLRPYLDRIAMDASATLALYVWNADRIISHALTNEFWLDIPAAAGELIDWFHSSEVSLLILEAYGIDLNPPQGRLP